MSLAKVNRFSRSSGRRPTQSRTVKQEWVSTIHDLNVHKATPEELKRRHDLHKSQNRVVAQWEMKRVVGHKLKKTSSGLPRPAQLDPAHLNIIREVFSDKYQLQDVLARSDGVLAVVNDLFGDAPHRQTGLPNVTVAPDSGPDPDLPVLLRPEPSTPLSLLSQSIMDPQALNEFEDVSGREYNDEEPDPSSTHSSRVDMSRFGRLLQEEAQGLGAQQETPQSPCPQISSLTEKPAARKRVSSQNSKQCCGEPLGHDSLTKNRSSLHLLQSMLSDVEAELDSLELQEPLATKEHSSPSLTGFSVSLLRTVTRLARCLHQSREDLQREVQDRKSLEEEVMEQRRLIDALTAETLTLREESLALQGQVQQCVWDTEQRHRVRPFADSTAPYCVESEAEPHYGEREAQEQPLPSPARADDLSPGPAVLLSPPRQRSSLHPHSHSTDCTSVLAEQGMSLQLQAVPSQEHCCSDQKQILPQAIILQQITELTQQNALIRTQLQQFCTQPAGPQDPGPHRASDKAAQLQEKAPPAGRCMEQRLLELNRQSTEARCRLLELIEEQTQTSVRAVSPSVSPILPSMRTLLSASADGERRTTDVSVSVPKQNFSPVASCCGCRSASGSSVNGAIGENQSLVLQSQVDRLKDEGWFALSTHLQ
ncbi:spindle and centriole-associated protein 1 isoform X1 [Anguilla anguilla]|uniref:spindle and centriole-associated protein 1 isoform X1 n=1 Tax=Anguilla anguilla TaxID=7936 RepID=UPI0015B071C0|nr:spindle and centriole-associated protein 1 isoform X1 [Anguilla anguilla]